ncbi:MAG: protein kinase [Sandaracinus sp.]
MSVSPPSTTLEPGARLGDLEIVRTLSSGGMATLYLAKRRGPGGFGRFVAVKVIHAALAADPHFVRMFVDEARVSARIRHPNVVHVEALAEDEGHTYLVLDYIHGVTLRALLRALGKQQRRLAPELSVHIAMKVAEALHAAHETRGGDGAPLGVVHRDVSPDNVLLAYDGQVKLIDFGIAKARDRLVETIGPMLKGKVRYMAPEQARGEAVDRRTDVYALGIVLWECLTQRRRARGDHPLEILANAREPEHEPPSRYAPWLGTSLDGPLARALANDPRDRFETAAAFRRALAGALPAAATLEADDLASVVRTAMVDELAKDAALLPAEISSVAPLTKTPNPTLTLRLEAPVEPPDDAPSDSGGPLAVAAPATSHEPSIVQPLPLLGPSPRTLMAALAVVVLLGLVGAYALGGPASPTGTVPSGTVPTGTVPTGTVPTGTVPTGTVPTGTLPTGTVPTGTVPTGTVQTGTVQTAAVPTGTVQTGTVQSAAVPTGTVPTGTVPTGMVPAGPAFADAEEPAHGRPPPRGDRRPSPDSSAARPTKTVPRATPPPSTQHGPAVQLGANASPILE